MPDKVIDGNHTWVMAQRPAYGDIVHYNCDPGFTLVGHPQRTCKKGEYDSAAPTCKGIRCSMPDKVIDGNHTWVMAQRPAYGDIVHYNCDPGFTLVGHPQRTCKKGEYDSAAPTCKATKF
ncbi:hypothetical protein CRUP_018847 [Coryphaenoides rupestris]|nr:hypothetical protein CRUP_018847 [Coryphaenoides rupestris]